MELSILGNYQQTSNKIMKNQGENKKRNNTFDSHEFIHFTADLTELLSICIDIDISTQNKQITTYKDKMKDCQLEEKFYYGENI